MNWGGQKHLVCGSTPSASSLWDAENTFHSGRECSETTGGHLNPPDFIRVWKGFQTIRLHYLFKKTFQFAAILELPGPSPLQPTFSGVCGRGFRCEPHMCLGLSTAVSSQLSHPLQASLIPGMVLMVEWEHKYPSVHAGGGGIVRGCGPQHFPVIPWEVSAVARRSEDLCLFLTSLVAIPWSPDSTMILSHRNYWHSSPHIIFASGETHLPYKNLSFTNDNTCRCLTPCVLYLLWIVDSVCLWSTYVWSIMKGEKDRKEVVRRTGY